MVKSFEGGSALIEQWLKNKDTVLFLAVWEQIHNPEFNSLEFEGIRSEAGRNSFYLSAKKWIERTGAIGLSARTGRYGGTFAHKDIAFEFGSWLSPEFKLYLIKEFDRLKNEESQANSLEWSFQRTLAKVNYRIHTDAVRDRLIPPQVTKAQAMVIYASEADLLNVASLEQLVVLSNLESINSVLIHQGVVTGDRLRQLNQIAIHQMTSLVPSGAARKLAPRPSRMPKLP